MMNDVSGSGSDIIDKINCTLVHSLGNYLSCHFMAFYVPTFFLTAFKASLPVYACIKKFHLFFTSLANLGVGSGNEMI
jgi:hypothetical protein